MQCACEVKATCSAGATSEKFRAFQIGQKKSSFRITCTHHNSHIAHEHTTHISAFSDEALPHHITLKLDTGEAFVFKDRQ